MKNIISPADKLIIIDRVNKLSQKNKSLWGKMNVNEMICHCSDQLRMSLGEIETKYVGNLFQSTFLKQLTLLGLPIPKEKIETTKELSQEKDGTRPTDFYIDKTRLINFIENFEDTYKNNMRTVHPVFGALTKNQWARLAWLHLNHHLKQFGV